MSILDGKDGEESILPTGDGTIIKTTNIGLHYEGEAASREAGERAGHTQREHMNDKSDRWKWILLAECNLGLIEGSMWWTEWAHT